MLDLHITTRQPYAGLEVWMPYAHAVPLHAVRDHLEDLDCGIAPTLDGTMEDTLALLTAQTISASLHADALRSQLDAAIATTKALKG